MDKVSGGKMNVNDEIDELKKIIQEAWNTGDSIRTSNDTFGNFLDRAAKGIYSQGYRKRVTSEPKRAGTKE